MSGLDISSLDRALGVLRIGLETLRKAPDDRLYRDGVIQRFEFTYGLCHRMLLRSLEQTLPDNEAVDQMSFAALVRTGSERGLLKSGWDRWQRFREARNIPSHTYDQAKADQVLSVIPDFLIEAQYLYEHSSNVSAEPVTLAVAGEKPASVVLSPEGRKIVLGILQQFVGGREVWAFGSRASGVRVKRYSDLDLAIEGSPLPELRLAELADAFDECSLPFKVDLVEVAALDPEFRKRIEADKIVLLAQTEPL